MLQPPKEGMHGGPRAEPPADGTTCGETSLADPRSAFDELLKPWNLSTCPSSTWSEAVARHVLGDPTKSDEVERVVGAAIDKAKQGGSEKAEEKKKKAEEMDLSDDSGQSPCLEQKVPEVAEPIAPVALTNLEPIVLMQAAADCYDVTINFVTIERKCA